MSLAVGVVAVAAGVLALLFVIDGNAEALGTAGVRLSDLQFYMTISDVFIDTRYSWRSHV